jgi:NAD(P)-dependent dehydrogenase (short-subunit alcohol dehydrogenase family)
LTELVDSINKAFLENWNTVITVNFTGTMLCSREVLKSMIPRKSGTIINISSVAGISGVPGRGAYSSSKWGIIGSTASLSTEVGEYNIRVNSISPAATNSQRFMNIVQGRAEERGITKEEMLDKVLAQYSMNRLVDSFEVARVALCLALDDFSAVTGQNIVVDCGFHMLHPSEIL